MSGAVVLTVEQLEILCREWQALLGLSDWHVVVRMKRERDMERKEAAGEVSWAEHRREAVVKITDPCDYPPTAIFPQDMESTLVHELLHLHFALIGYKDETIEDALQEQALHAVAAGLVALKRKEGVAK